MKHRHFIFLFFLIFSISLASFFIPDKKEGKKIVEVYSNGTLVHTVDLDTVNTPYELPVTLNNHTNIVLIEKNNISVKSADCPDKLCVKQGHLSSYPIVCVPNKLYIKSTNNSENIDGISR